MTTRKQFLDGMAQMRGALAEAKTTTEAAQREAETEADRDAAVAARTRPRAITRPCVDTRALGRRPQGLAPHSAAGTLALAIVSHQLARVASASSIISRGLQARLLNAS